MGTFICLAIASADDSVTQQDEWSEITTAPGKCTKNAPSNGGKACTVESDCGNTEAGKYYCQAAEDYTGRRRRKGGKCAQNSPQNAGKSCYGMESNCGNTNPNLYYCQASLLAETTTAPGKCTKNSPS